MPASTQYNTQSYQRKKSKDVRGKRERAKRFDLLLRRAGVRHIFQSPLSFFFITYLANPKSPSFSSPLFVKKILGSLISRWMI